MNWLHRTFLPYKHHRTARGSTMVWAIICVMVIMGFASLAVDWGRVQATKSELQAAVDAAARYAVTGMSHATDPVGVTRARYDAAIIDNKIDGSVRSDLTTTVFEYGNWDSSAKTFTVLSGTARNTANCIRVKAVYGDQANSRLDLTFASLLGFSGMRVTAETYIQVPSNTSTSTTVSATSNVWFAGQPSTATANFSGDITYASSSPAQQVTGGTFSVKPGATISITSTGSLSNVPWTYGISPDGDGWICNNWTNNLGGLSNCSLPINSVVAVFISDADPTASAAPADLDFSTQAARDYTTISPQLKQTFFVGDGYTSTGVKQTIVVPPGATRLYLGSMDPYGWYNNAGSVISTITSSSNIVMVK